jgi:glycosyltransferase involved in cell wall biosynthesis
MPHSLQATPILLDVSRLIWRSWAGSLPTGIDRTCLAYIEHYGSHARAVVQRSGYTFVLPQDRSRALFDLLAAQGGNLRRSLITAILRNLSLVWRTPQVNGALYLNVGHTGLNMPGLPIWIRRTGVKPVYFVHDLIPITHPEYCRAGEPEKHEQRIRALLGTGVGVIGNSRETIDALSAYAAQQRLPTPPACVAPLGVPMHLKSADTAPPLARPYFVMLGTIEGRKNHLLMLNIWSEMARNMGHDAPQLVIIGQRGWECEQAVDMLDRCDALRGHVIELSRCNDALLTRYLTHARALLFPSFIEGYGLPLVEALASGTPVIASSLPVFRELAGDIPDYISPIDGAGWMQAVKDYAAPASPRRAAQCDRLASYTIPGWADHFAVVDDWLSRLSTVVERTATPGHLPQRLLYPR